MSDFSIPIIQWIQNLKHHLHFILLSCSRENTFIHSCKFQEMGTYLLEFLKKIDQYSSPRDSSLEENQRFRNLLYLIEDMTKFVKMYDRDHFLNSIIAYKTNVVAEKIKNFRTRFNELCRLLNLVSPNAKQPYPQNTNQFILNDIYDSKTLVKEIENLLNNNNNNNNSKADVNKVVIDNQQVLRQRILELHSNINERQMVINTQAKVLNSDDVSKQLEKYKEWEANLNDYILSDQIIGKGTFSIVYLGCNKVTNKIVAIKQLHRTEFTQKELEMYKREIDTLLGAQHPCLLPFLGITLQHPYCILTEYISGGTLFSRLHRKELNQKILTPTNKTIIAIGVAHGMEFLHSKNLIHRDLKSLNILLDEEGLPFIGDFGLSRSLNTEKDLMTKGVGTSQWMAPEVLNSEHYNCKVDVYSFAIIMWELLTEEIPYKDVLDHNVVTQVLNFNKRPAIPEDCPQNIASFISDCWDRDPDHRPSFQTIVKMLDSGEIEFTGTEREEVDKYLESIITEDDLRKSALEIFQGMNEKSSQENIEALKQLETKDLVDALVQFLTEATESKQITQFLKLCFEAHEELSLEFEPAFPAFFNFLKKNVNSEIILLSSKIANENKESPFYFGVEELQVIILYMNEAGIDINALNLLHTIAENRLLHDNADFCAVIPGLLISVQIAQTEDVLISILSLFEKIMNYPEFVSTIIENNGEVILSIALLRSPQIPLKLLRHVFSNNPAPNIQCAELIIPRLKDLLIIDPILTLQILKLLLQLKGSFKLFGKLPQNPLVTVLTTDTPDSIIILALKVSFSLFSNPSTFNLMLEIEKVIESHLLSENLAIAQLSALCLTLLPRDCIDLLCNDTISQFLTKALQPNKEYNHSNVEKRNNFTVCALRIAGIMTDTKEGTEFVMKFIDLLFPLLRSENDNVRRFTFIIFTAFSTYDQEIECFNDCIEMMIENAQKYDGYPLIFLANVTVNPDLATTCSKYIDKLIKLMDDEIYDSFPIIWRISTTPESFDQWSTSMRDLVKCLMPFADGDIHQLVMELFQSISICKAGKCALRDENVNLYLKEKLIDVAADDPMKPVYVRIMSRIKNVL
ncbi:hypothetical protein TRFO_31225 [Tritrichomonas foetus]|uniref:Protein kinase domain-containing protein n=1 Tax=Tritrichomonas foetus TaxID=1144522 RepID=A0A1J4JX74_9EUKA|nr:hypothetical protein TRFO_31225 [Tritrichomonas foetus]|eukprot:OHT01877.1 hypothetical protein TRFO_31225 [Tritrichomonas foetus]